MTRLLAALAAAAVAAFLLVGPLALKPYGILIRPQGLVGRAEERSV